MCRKSIFSQSLAGRRAQGAGRRAQGAGSSYDGPEVGFRLRFGDDDTVLSGDFTMFSMSMLHIAWFMMSFLFSFSHSIT